MYRAHVFRRASTFFQYHIGVRMDDAINQHGKLFECIALFGEIFVAVVDALRIAIAGLDSASPSSDHCWWRRRRKDSSRLRGGH
jgi:hypothetical protein